MNMPKLRRLASVLCLLCAAAPHAQAGEIDTFPDPSLPFTLGATYPVGEVSATNPALSIPSGHRFATYFGQSFVALPGLAQELTVGMVGPDDSPIAGTDGIDFYVHIAETTFANGVHTPTTIVHSSPLLTLGAQQGTQGTAVTGPYVTIDLGGLDLIDGAVYEWVVDTVSPADGIEGWGSIWFRHQALPNLAGNSSILVWDLETNTAMQPWNNVDTLDLAFRMTFADGGVAAPVLPALGTLPFVPVPVPEPGMWASMALGLIAVGAMARRRKPAGSRPFQMETNFSPN